MLIHMFGALPLLPIYGVPPFMYSGLPVFVPLCPNVLPQALLPPQLPVEQRVYTFVSEVFPKGASLHPVSQNHVSQNAEKLGARKRRARFDYNCNACGTNSTPEWRNGPPEYLRLCNACGIHFMKHKQKNPNSAWTPENRVRKFVVHPPAVPQDSETTAHQIKDATTQQAKKARRMQVDFLLNPVK